MAAAVGLMGCGGGSHTINGRTELSIGACISDFPIAVKVFDENKTLIAQGTIKPVGNGGNCDNQSFKIADVPKAKFYTFTVEGDEGKHTFSYNDLVDADWTVSLKRTP